MVTNKLSALVLAAIALTCAPMSHAADAKDALASFHAALVAGDRAKVLELLAPEVAIYEAGYVERSREEYAAHHMGGDMEFAKTSSRKVLRQTERVAGDTAIIWQETETTGTSSDKAVHAFRTETAVLQNKGGAWSILHIHWSSRKVK